ncbi:MAG: acyl-CoA dehydrogenase family protein [Pirellulales bacterium]
MSTETGDRRPASELTGRKESFAETALKLGGKSAEEARRTGAIDAADDQVEGLFQPQYQTVNSPVHRAVWERSLPTDLFGSHSDPPAADIQAVMDRSWQLVAERRRAGSLLDEHGKVRADVLSGLGDVGYWGLLVDREYGGSGTPFRHFASFLTWMATADPTVAGLASVHGCIGAVDPVRTFGSPEQKRRFLPELASGRRLSAFALTEPCAGSDLTALRTEARLEGDRYLVRGEKLFITNVVPGRTIGLVCLIEGKPAVLICDLPETETDSFQLKRYGLWALKHTHNQGIVFRDFAVPAENLLQPGRGDGLTIAYHGLNLGRVALCANAAGTMRLMLASILPWAQYRVTYGEKIASRELVRRRAGRLAGMIVACDALVQWCSRLLDDGYRGEMECIIAKIFGSESQKTAAVELFMKTHGGRSFLHGHMFGDNVHEYLAPCIYEGEGEMLGMAFFKSLVKHHGTMYFEPIGRALYQAGIKKPNLANPAHAWALRGPLWKYAKWYLGHQFAPRQVDPLPTMPARLRAHAQFAVAHLQRSGMEISGTMRKHQLKLADRQCRMAELSARLQSLVIMLCTSLYASRQEDELIRDAADVMCSELRRQFTGERASDGDFRRETQLGAAVVDGGFRSIAGLHPDEILMPYPPADK